MGVGLWVWAWSIDNEVNRVYTSISGMLRHEVYRRMDYRVLLVYRVV